METLLNFFNPYHYGKTDINTIPETVKDCLPWPRDLFRISLLVGTVLFGVYMVTHYSPLLIVGLFYTVLAIWLNLFVLVCYLLMAAVHYRFAILILKKTSVMLINIPIVLLYLILLNL